MQDIKRLLMSTLTGDATLAGLLGATEDDPRVYWYYQGDASITADKPGYLTYAMLSDGEHASAAVGAVFSLNLWTKDLSVLEAIRDRLMTLLERKVLTTDTGRTCYAKKISEADQFQQQPYFAGRSMQFRFGYSTVGGV